MPEEHRFLKTTEEIIEQLLRLRDKTVAVYIPVSVEAEMCVLGKLDRTKNDQNWRVLCHGPANEAAAVLFTLASVKQLAGPSGSSTGWQVQLKPASESTATPSEEFR